MQGVDWVRLAAPFPEETIRWRPVRIPSDGGLWLRAQLAAPALIARLDEVLGREGWSVRYRAVGTSVSCELTIAGATRSAVVDPAPGEGAAECSRAAFAAAAACFGIVPSFDPDEDHWVDHEEALALGVDVEAVLTLAHGNHPVGEWGHQPAAVDGSEIPYAGAAHRAGAPIPAYADDSQSEPSREGVHGINGSAGADAPGQFTRAGGAGAAATPRAGSGGEAAGGGDRAGGAGARTAVPGDGGDGPGKPEGQVVIDRLVDRLRQRGLGLDVARLTTEFGGYGSDPERARELYRRLRELLARAEEGRS